ncbi:DUF397 domain-containing protein [Streptomyces sp. TRM 70351]|uniref:DUF397 domain-containing protein n=1 Tax=Streptomyces sp. TRM 70351 TaxID=3116552 RepID=UPI002E7B004A|nr:DUF397 domain-containing protein [Streptomyces sp. TRM 70351]MEE1929333.1 DUF397 domain-containing protein [Streptomyces sp. TRM 70351]
MTDFLAPHWVKSSYSNNGGSCVEWAPRVASVTGTVPVRDSKNPAGPVLGVPADSFSAFVAGVKARSFGLV